MSDEHLTIEVSHCPVCDGAHTYEVEPHLISGMKMPKPGVCLSPQPVNLTETFTCPETHEEFDHGFEIRLPAGSVVAGVEIEQSQ
jgi:hypothetical protein